MQCQVSRDNGKTWSPLGNARVTAGGLDQGQTDKSQSGKVAISSSGTTTVQLGTVTAGKTLYISDVFFQLDTGGITADVAIQAGGVTIWEAQASNSPVGQTKQRPLTIAGGVAVTIVWGQASSGSPNAYHNLGMWEE